jgi:hypothetical protein
VSPVLPSIAPVTSPLSAGKQFFMLPQKVVDASLSLSFVEFVVLALRVLSSPLRISAATIPFVTPFESNASSSASANLLLVNLESVAVSHIELDQKMSAISREDAHCEKV